MPALGPTATITGGLLTLVLAAAFLVTSRRWPVTYALISAAGGVLALLTVVNAFTADPSLWPSEFWRYSGVALNCFGVVGTIAGVVTALGQRRHILR